MPNEPAFEFGGGPAWAEIILVRLLERAGWPAVWVKNWHGRAFWRDLLDEIELPSGPAALFSEIEARMGFARRLLGCLRLARPRCPVRLTPNQRKWLEKALAVGTPLSAFAVVEWFTEPVARR